MQYTCRNGTKSFLNSYLQFRRDIMKHFYQDVFCLVSDPLQLIRSFIINIIIISWNSSGMKIRMQLQKDFYYMVRVPCIWLFLRVKDAIENVAEHVVLKSRCTTTSLHASISSISLESWGHWPDQAKPTLENENMIALQGPPIWENLYEVAFVL